MPCRFMRLSQQSHQYGWNDYSSVVLGAFFLHAALLAGLVITCCSPHISLFGCAERFRLRFVVRCVGPSIWCPAFKSLVLVFLCVSAALLTPSFFSTFIRYFQVWSAVVDVVEPTSPVCSAYTSFFFFFREPCRYMRLTTFPTPFGFIRCELQYFKQFR